MNNGAAEFIIDPPFRRDSLHSSRGVYRGDVDATCVQYGSGWKNSTVEGEGKGRRRRGRKFAEGGILRHSRWGIEPLHSSDSIHLSNRKNWCWTKKGMDQAGVYIRPRPTGSSCNRLDCAIQQKFSVQISFSVMTMHACLAKSMNIFIAMMLYLFYCGSCWLIVLLLVIRLY